MAKICGTPEDARKVAEFLGQSAAAVQTCVSDLERGANTIRSAWDDEGVQVVDEMVASIKTALANASESIPNIKNALERYAEFLERK